jgi:hypothetical protein
MFSTRTPVSTFNSWTKSAISFFQRKIGQRKDRNVILCGRLRMGWSLVIIAMRDGSPPVLGMPNCPTAKPEDTHQQRQARTEPGKRSPYIHHDVCVLSPRGRLGMGQHPDPAVRGQPMGTDVGFAFIAAWVISKAYASRPAAVACPRPYRVCPLNRPVLQLEERGLPLSSVRPWLPAVLCLRHQIFPNPENHDFDIRE